MRVCQFRHFCANTYVLYTRFFGLSRSFSINSNFLNCFENSFFFKNALPCLVSQVMANLFFKKRKPYGFSLTNAEEGSRTLKVLLPHGPEPCASANSATSAFLLCRFVYISQRQVELYYKTVILSTTFSKKYFLKKFKKVLAKSFRLWYIITRR